MKKAYPWLVALIALSLLFVGCSSSSDDDDGISAPDLPDASSITMSGATRAPSTEAEAQTLYTDSVSALADFIGTNLSSSSSRLSRANARQTASETKSLNKEISSPNGGKVILAGTYTLESTEPDNNTAFKPNHTYEDFFGYSLNADATGTMDSVKVKNGTHTYTICGTLKETYAFDMNVDYTTGATQDVEGTSDLDFSFGIGLGTAVSVVREDGVGAKFVISYAANYGKDDISLADDSEDMTTATKELADYLGKQTATLSVYDQNNVLQYTTTLSADDQVNAASIF